MSKKRAQKLGRLQPMIRLGSGLFCIFNLVTQERKIRPGSRGGFLGAEVFLWSYTSDKAMQPRPEWKRSGCRAKRQDQDHGNDIRNRLQGQGNSGTSVKLLATPPTHHQGCPRRKGSKMGEITEVGPRYERENGPRYVRGKDRAESAGIRQNSENKEQRKT
ncbi:hypothetical protein BDP27DRAFT_1364725 [Rhodocollybia butyracea]|uniref:Uncharacterized protein n=1 Tax=Rhodocollybia butyracea TaxID=206335 RepID=A0A9P5U6E9_9AGAR|nr:hypothetical protein BDP27DRAFT_1364725 [Rhodocollybia butyracea]